MKLDNYRQDVEGEMWALVAAITFLIVVVTGSMWALVFILRWWVIK